MTLLYQTLKRLARGKNKTKIDKNNNLCYNIFRIFKECHLNQKIKTFNPAGVLKLNMMIAKYDRELYPLYLSTLVNFIGQNRGQLPTQKNENLILQNLKAVLVDDELGEIIIRTQRLLTRSRKKRMQEAILYI